MDKLQEIDQQKLLRLFKMIWLMSPPRGKTVNQLVELLDVSSATVYRYLTFLEETDFLEVQRRGKHRIVFDKISDKGYINIKFGHDELECISEALLNTFPELDISRGIRAKLFQHLSLGLKSQSSIVRNTPMIIRDLHQAMKDKRQVALEYFSANNGRTDKRIVEPLEFTDLHRYLIVYDAKASIKITNLKTSRIQSVDILTIKSTQSPDIIKGIDVFDIACYQDKYQVELNMSALAYRLMIEEYPKTESCFRKLSTEGGDIYRFSTVVFSLLPVSRFVMGLPGMIQIIEPQALVIDIQNKMKKFNAF